MPGAELRKFLTKSSPQVYAFWESTFGTQGRLHRSTDSRCGGRARLRVRNLGVFDDHDIANSVTLGVGLNGDPDYPFPMIDPVAPTRATVSFEVEWNGILDMAQIHNSAQTFQGTFLSTGASIRWTAEQPGFRFESEAPNPARNLISVLGHEQNGVFFS